VSVSVFVSLSHTVGTWVTGMLVAILLPRMAGLMSTCREAGQGKARQDRRKTRQAKERSLGGGCCAAVTLFTAGCGVV
jgi:UPF0716 family protein affecting phage T7 exclusion